MRAESIYAFFLRGRFAALGRPYMIWLKALHISALVIWCAGLFYLPGLFMLHPRTRDHADYHRLRIMTRYSFIMVISPAAVIAIISGTLLVYVRGLQGDWLAAKLVVVTLMVFFHLYCGGVLAKLRDPKVGSMRRPLLHLATVIVPAILIPLVLWLVLAKPTLLGFV
jgi:putative membrane protein